MHHHISRRRLLVRSSALALAPLFAQRALAQAAAYPDHPIRLIVPNAPGSSVDTIGRIAAAHMQPLLKQPLVVDNRAGAAGALGVEVARSSAPDGYGLLLASSSAISVAPLLQKAVRYDPLKDFEYVSLIALLPNVLVCNPSLPVHGTAEFIAWAKSKNGKSNQASAGIGSVSHLAGVALQSAAGFESLHVPYKGGAQGVTSVVAGETDWVLTPAPAAMALVAAGRLRILGHSMGPSAHPLPGVPSIGETVKGFEFSSWIGLMAPKGMPGAIGDTLRAALAGALRDPALIEAFQANGAVPESSSAAGFRDYVARDIELNRKAIAIAGVQPE